MRPVVHKQLWTFGWIPCPRLPSSLLLLVFENSKLDKPVEQFWTHRVFKVHRVQFHVHSEKRPSKIAKLEVGRGTIVDRSDTDREHARGNFRAFFSSPLAIQCGPPQRLHATDPNIQVCVD